MTNENFLYASLLEMLADGMKTGNRQETVAKMTKLLLNFGVQEEKAFKLIEFMNNNTDEPLDQKELERAFKQQNITPTSKDERLKKILKNISEYAYTEDRHIRETLDARLMNDYLELADILGIDPEKYI